MNAFTTVVELARAIQEKKVSTREVIDAAIGRIQAENPALNAIVTTDFERATARASEADAALARGEHWGPLHGVPFTLKDGLMTAGVRTTVGAPPFADHIPIVDSFVAARLKAVGGILLGKTNVPPMLMSAQTNNPIFGRTNNPWNLERTVGGSSGGSAAAVAAGLVPFDVGSDLSGSIRMPAHFCGVFGIKPTSNRIPTTGHIPPPPGVPRPDRLMGAVGPLTRSVADLELVTEVLSVPDGVEHEVAPVPWRRAKRPDVKDLRIAFRSSFPNVPTSSLVSGAVLRVARELEQVGAVIEERDPGFEIPTFNKVWVEALRCLGTVLMDLFGSALPVPTKSNEDNKKGPPTITDWVRLLERRDTLISALEALFDRFDVFMSPATITTAFPHSPPLSPIPVDGIDVESRFVDHYLYPFSFTGHPCVVIPAGIADDGLPVGVQLVGKRWSDEKLLATAASISEVIGGFRAPPKLL